jgi:transposase
MQTITTIGLDVAKSVFQVHAASSHHWSRERQALGHTVPLMPPAYVKPYELRCCSDQVGHPRGR